MLRSKHFTISLLFIISFGMITFTLLSIAPGVKAAPMAPLADPSILIDGNTELDAYCGNETSGNATHPHIIENMEIVSDGPQNGIKITNTDRHLILRDVNVTNFSQSSNSRGILIINCTNIIIDSCLFVNNSYGIVFENTNYTRFIDTSGSYNFENGITFTNCHHNYLYNTAAIGNGLEENDGNGMNMYYSNNNTIEYCLFI